MCSKDLLRLIIDRMKSLHSLEELERNPKDFSSVWEGMWRMLQRIDDKNSTGEYELALHINQGGIRNVFYTPKESLKR